MQKQLSEYDPFLLTLLGERWGDGRSSHTRAKEPVVGIELEYEGVRITDGSPNPDDWRWWSAHAEGSLRGGVELVSRSPTSLTNLPQAFEELKQITKNASYQNSIRTSTHIHVNAKNLTLLQIYTVLTAYYLVENILVHLNGPDRVGNLHCLRLIDAVEIASKLAEEIKDREYFNGWNNSFRYAALNISALRKFGTLEFRFMKAFTAIPELRLWVVNLVGLVEQTVRNFQTPQDVMNFFYANRSRAFLERFFTDEFINLIRSQIEPPLVKRMLSGNTVYIYEIISGLTHGGQKYVKPFIGQSHEDLPPSKYSGQPQQEIKKKKASVYIDDFDNAAAPHPTLQGHTWTTVSTVSPTLTNTNDIDFSTLIVDDTQPDNDEF